MENISPLVIVFFLFLKIELFNVMFMSVLSACMSLYHMVSNAWEVVGSSGVELNIVVSH